MEERSSASGQSGGSVEPLDPPTPPQASKSKSKNPTQRFELRDPFAEVTHRAATFDQMVAIANRVGAVRFTAISSDGSRSSIAKVGGVWPHEPKADQSRTSQATTNSAPPRLPAGKSPSIAPPVADIPLDIEPSGAAHRARLEASLNERYVIKRAPLRIGDLFIGQTEYRHRGDTSRIAFTESASKISTDTNSPSVARSMVDLAEARGWPGLRVSGNDEFKRMVWLEASLRGVKTVGYDALAADHEALRKERAARPVNHLERSEGNASTAATPAEKQSTRGGARKAVLAALEAVLIAKGIPDVRRAAVMADAAANLAARVRNGETHRVKVYDRAAPSRQSPVAPARDLRRDRERAVPTR